MNVDFSRLVQAFVLITALSLTMNIGLGADMDLSMERDIYDFNESIDFTITNEGEETIQISNDQHVTPDEIERLEDGTWEEINFDYREQTMPASVFLEPEESYTYTWDQTEYDEDGNPSPAGSGEYRVTWYEQENFTIRSENIEVRTDKEEYSIGEDVKTYIENHGEETITISTTTPATPDYIRRYNRTTEKWEEINFDDQDEVGTATVDLEPGDNESYTWDQMEYTNDEGTQVDPGNYEVEWENETSQFTIEEEEKEKEVEVWTDKTEYEREEDVEIYIENQGDEEFMLSSTSLIVPDEIERLEDGNWEEINFEDQDEGLTVPQYLPPGENESYTWDQTEYSDGTSEWVGTGEYRVEWENETSEFEIVEPEEEYELQVFIEGYGEVTIDQGDGIYEEGETVTVTAEPEGDWFFNKWTGDYDGISEQITVEMNDDKEITAHFTDEEIIYYNLTINVEGDSTTNPEPGTHYYEENEDVKIEAITINGEEFVNWTEDVPTGEEDSETITVTMDENKEITAHFQEEDIEEEDDEIETTPGEPTAATALTIISITIIFAAATIICLKKKGIC